MRYRTLTAGMLLTSLLLAACTADDMAGDGWRMSADEAGEPASPPAEAHSGDAELPDEAMPVEPDTGPPGSEGIRPAGATIGRAVIRTAAIDLAVPDPGATVDEVARIAEDAGGLVATADLRRDDEGVLRGTVTIRVPSEDLLATLDALDDLAEGPSSRRIDERDVTTEVADLEARLANLTTYERELNGLLAEVRQTTTDPEDLLRVFERVRQVREEIDVLQGRLTVLSDQVSLATIAVNVQPARKALPVTDPTWRPDDTLREAVTALTRTLGSVADGLIWFAVAVLPVLLLAAAPFAAVTAVWLRRRAATTGPTTPQPSDP
jgi:hypothetical protein